MHNLMAKNHDEEIWGEISPMDKIKGFKFLFEKLFFIIVN